MVKFFHSESEKAQSITSDFLDGQEEGNIACHINPLCNWNWEKLEKLLYVRDKAQNMARVRTLFNHIDVSSAETLAMEFELAQFTVSGLGLFYLAQFDNAKDDAAMLTKLKEAVVAQLDAAADELGALDNAIHAIDESDAKCAYTPTCHILTHEMQKTISILNKLESMDETLRADAVFQSDYTTHYDQFMKQQTKCKECDVDPETGEFYTDDSRPVATDGVPGDPIELTCENVEEYFMNALTCKSFYAQDDQIRVLLT